MTEDELLFANIIRNPSDDIARLVYADWLEEHSNASRANFIRDQIEERLGSQDFDLLDYHWDEWFPDVKLHPEIGFARCRHPGRGSLLVTLASGAQIVFDRGFIHEVRFLNISRFMAAAKSHYWNCQPICKVVIHGREPLKITGETWRWFASAENQIEFASELPLPLFWAFHDNPHERPEIRLGESWDFSGRRAALDALCNGAVAYGRKLAGLPPLLIDQAPHLAPPN